MRLNARANRRRAKPRSPSPLLSASQAEVQRWNTHRCPDAGENVHPQEKINAVVYAKTNNWFF